MHKKIGKNIIERRYYEALFKKIKSYYKERLVAIAVFGSFARCEQKLNSDLDFLVVLKDEESHGIGFSKRIAEFVKKVETPLDSLVSRCWKKGNKVELSPLILTESEAKRFNPLYLDMVTASIIIEDKNNFLRSVLDEIRKKMAIWGSRKVQCAGHWYWEVKPSIKMGEVIDYDK